MSEDFVDRWVQRLRRDVPDAVAIFFAGSQLRGDAGPNSDVDFDIVVSDGPRDEWPTWLEQVEGRLLRIDTWIRDADTWLSAADQPQGWAFYLPCADSLRLCWAVDESWRQRLDRTQLIYPAGEPELDHLPGDVAKLVNAWHHHDLALRLAAQDLARTIVSLLQPLNPRPLVHSRVAALRSLLGFDVVPAGYRDHMLVCLGLVDNATGPRVAAAARELAAGVLDLLHTTESATFTELLGSHRTRTLRDGSLRRLIDQTLADTE